MSFYAVKKGARPGVYATWPECKVQVHGFPGAVYRKFEIEEEARRFVSGDPPASAETKANEIALYTDGACSGNPGKGGYGYAVVINDTLSLNGSGGMLATTNNQMELTAVIEGLKVIPNEYPVVVYTDSSYVVNAFEKGWIAGWRKRNWLKADGEPVANRELWEGLLSAMDAHPPVRFVWLKGHAGNPYNEMCDRLAVDAIRSL